MTRFVSHTDLKMRYVAAALLLALAEDKITAANIEKILSSVGVESDKEKLALVSNTFSFHVKLIQRQSFKILNRVAKPPKTGSYSY